jgi:hypothetical protein
VDYSHHELVKLGLRTLEILLRPPVTRQYGHQMPRLSADLARHYLRITCAYEALYQHLLESEEFDPALVAHAAEILNTLRAELTDHYKEFFLPTARDTPSQDLREFDKYICRILKVTNHLGKSHPDHAPLLTAIRAIDDATGVNSSTQAVLLAFAERYCIVGLGKKVSQKFINSLITRGGAKYRSRFVIPWYRPPLFLAYDILVTELREYMEMVHARYETGLEVTDGKAPRRADAYGEVDVLKQQIAGARSRLAAATARQEARVAGVNALADFTKSLRQESDPANAFRQARDFVDRERMELEAVIRAQETEKQLTIEAERTITKEIMDEIARVELEIEELVQRILTLQATCEIRRVEIDEKTRESAAVAARCRALREKATAKQARMEKAQRECESLKEETDQLNLKIQGMAAEEAKVRMRMEMEIAIQEEQIAELEETEKRERAVLDELVARQGELEEVIVPELEYQVSKRADEIRFQIEFARRQKEVVGIATLGIMSVGIQEVVGGERDQEGLDEAMKRIGPWL